MSNVSSPPYVWASPAVAVSSTYRGAPSAPSEPNGPMVTAATIAPTPTISEDDRARRRRCASDVGGACGDLGTDHGRDGSAPSRGGPGPDPGLGRAAVRSGAAAKIASMTRMFATASSGSTGSGTPSRIGVGEAIRLARVRIGDVEGQRLGRGCDRRVAARGHEDPGRAVGRDVERDLDGDPALGAVDVDPLVRLRARGAGERRDPGVEARGSALVTVSTPSTGSRVMAAWTRVGSAPNSIRDRFTV